MFGAAVRPDGGPSPTLARRVGYAAAAAQADPAVHLFLSGGVGRHGGSEASVMAALLDGHVAAARITLDEDSADTLQSVIAAARFARAHGYARVAACSDAYHQPRIRMLFALFGIRCDPLPVASRGAAKLRWRMRLREAAAIPYDLVAGVGAAARQRFRR